MRIALVNNYTRITGGADLHCRQLARALEERGHEVRWVATRAGGDSSLPGRFVERKVESSSRSLLSPIARILVARDALWNSESWQVMNDTLTGFRPDVVHVHKAYIHLSTSPVVAASRRGFPLVQTIHDYEFMSASSVDSTGRSWDSDEERFAYRLLGSATFPLRKYVHRPRIDKWIAVSDFVAERYRDATGIDPLVMPNFTIPPPGKPTGFEERNGVAYIGRLTEQKGLRILLEAARSSPEIEWFVFGPGPLEDEVAEASERTPNLHYGGTLELDQVGERLREVRAAIIPSTWEDPGPLACLEAMAVGTPVVCFSKGGLAEYVRAANGGVISETVGPEALVNSVKSLISNPGLWRRLSENGIQAVGMTHDLDSYVDRLLEVYEQAANEGQYRR